MVIQKHKEVTQPILTQTELNRQIKYARKVEKHGYEGWIGVKNSNTYGQGQRVYSHKTGRTHALLSRGEKLPFYTSERRPNVIDMLDQYPLPIDETLRIARELNIRHPGSYKARHQHDGQIPAVTMTTDLVLVIQQADGSKTLLALSFKYEEALDPEKRNYRRTREKLEIEEKYWTDQGAEFRLVTEKDFSETAVYNLQFLRECYASPKTLKLATSLKASVTHCLLTSFESYPERTLAQHCQHVAVLTNLTYEEVVTLFQHDVYEYRLPVCIEERIELYRPLQLNTGEPTDASEPKICF